MKQSANFRAFKYSVAIVACVYVLALFRLPAFDVLIIPIFGHGLFGTGAFGFLAALGLAILFYYFFLRVAFALMETYQRGPLAMVGLYIPVHLFGLWLIVKMGGQIQ